jgi:predicted AAA+ superfamily ATPase
MQRFIDKELREWKANSRRKPLIIRGARQVGKTYSIKQFGLNEFGNTAFCDLERNATIRNLFNGDLQAKRILSELEILLDQSIVPGKTLLFIDEIQTCPRAITALRYFYEEIPDLHVIAAGSLLDFALRDISFPVGRIQFLYLAPLTFAEFMTATGHREAVKNVLETPAVISRTLHDFLIDNMRRYFFVGGMPEAVKTYVETGSMKESFKVQAEICESFRLDFAKYSPGADKHCLDAVFTTTAQNVGCQTKYSKLAEGYSNPTIKKAYDLLCLAGVIRKIPATDPSSFPLAAGASGKIFKTVIVDIGLMRHLTGMPVDIEYPTPDMLNIYRGAMAEQFIGQEMIVAQKGDIFYWSRQKKSSSAKIDYLCSINSKIVPVEVKSGHSGTLKSMHLFLDTYQKCTKGFVFSSAPYQTQKENNLTFLPLYLCYCATGGSLDGLDYELSKV